MSDGTRCAWAGEDPLYVRYHDEEWGVPQREDRALFEKLCLEGQQAGLSWITVLRKRDRYRAQFFDFEWERVARLKPAGIDTRMQDAGLIRHRGKLEAIVHNAQAMVGLRAAEGSLSALLWSFVDGKTVQNCFGSMSEIPAKTKASEAMSKALKKHGFRFVGPTTCYAMMQACGLVNDHLIGCPRHQACASM